MLQDRIVAHLIAQLFHDIHKHILLVEIVLGLQTHYDLAQLIVLFHGLGVGAT